MKKSLVTFGVVMMALFGVKSYISTKNFKGNLSSILKMSGLNVEFDNVKLEKFNKIKISNLKVKDMENKVVIDAKEANASLNLLMPSRILRVDVNNAVVNLERRQNNDFNIFHVIKPSDKKKTYDNTSRIGKLYFHNSILNYRDVSFDKKIEKTLTNVNGFLETSKSRGFSLMAKGRANDEKIKINLSTLVNTEQSLKSLFDIKKNSDESRKEFRLAFDFGNVNITEELGQYVPLDMINAKGGKLNGNLQLKSKPKESMKVAGKLDVKNGTLKYVDFDGDIKNVNATIKMLENNIIVDAISKVEEKPVTFKMDYNLDKQNLKLNLATKEVPFSEIAKYKLIKDANIKANGNVTSNLDVYVEPKNKIVTLNGKFLSNEIEMYGNKFQNLKTSMKMDKNQMLVLENTTFHFDRDFNGFKVKNDVNIPKFSYDVKNKNGNGNYILKNKGSNYSVSQITGNLNINKDNLIVSNFNSKELNGNYIIDVKNSKVKVNANANENIKIKYGEQEYVSKPKLNLNIDTKDFTMNGDVTAPLLEFGEYKFGNVSTKIRTDKNQVLSFEDAKFYFDKDFSGFKVKNDVNIPKFSYDTKSKNGNGNYILKNKGSDYSVSQITGNLNINKDNLIAGNFNSKELNGNYIVDIKNSKVIVNANADEDIKIKYSGQEYVSKPKLNLNINTKDFAMNGNVSTPSLQFGDYKFNDVITKIKTDKNQVLVFEDANFYFDKDFSGFRVKNDVNIPKFSYDMKNKKGNGSYILKNRGSDYSVSQINGSLNINKDNLIKGSFNSKELNGNYIVDIKNSKININAKADENIKIKYSGQEYVSKPELNLNINTKDFAMNGNVFTPSLQFGDYKFNNINSKIKMDKNQVLALEDTNFYFDKDFNGFKVKNDVNISKFSYNLKNKTGVANFVLNNKGSDYSVKKVSGVLNINQNNDIFGKFYSNELDGNFAVSTKNSTMKLNAVGKGDTSINYGNQTYVVNPKINNLIFDFKRKDNMLVSGNIDSSLKLPQMKFLDVANAKVNINNGNYNVNGVVTTGGENIKVVGTTSKDMLHSYIIQSENDKIDIANMLRKYDFDFKGLKDASLPSTFVAKINGKGNKISGNYELKSSYGKYIAEYEELYANGKIEDLLNLNLDTNIKMDELWLGYQRLKNLSGNINIKDNLVSLNNFQNDKIIANGSYNLKNGNIILNSELNDYVVYNTTNPETNLYIDNLTANLNGSIDKLSGNIVMTPSNTTINSQLIGKTNAEIVVNNGVLIFDDVKLRNNQITGIYDLKTGLADISMKVEEDDIPKMFELEDVTFGTSSVLNLKGDLNKFDLIGEILFDNMSYKSYRLPEVKTNLEYLNGNVDKLFKYGTFNVKDFIVIGDNKEQLFRTNTQFDLGNINIDYKLVNQNFALDSVQDLKNKGYSGNINLNFLLQGKPENFMTDFKVKSDKLTLSGFPVENLDIDIMATNKNLNIGQIYMEYEKNPLSVTGYVDFSPLKYNMSVLAQNFNLAFLGVNQDVENASGIANIDIVVTKDQTSGTVKLDDFNYKTKDGKTDVNKLFTDITVDNTKLKINRLDGGYNGGTFVVKGDLDVPTIPQDFMETKRLELGKFEVDGQLNKIGVKYGENIDLTLSGNVKFTENNLFGNLTVDSGKIREIPSFGQNAEDTKQTSNNGKQKNGKDKSIVEGFVEEVIDKVINQYSVNINVQAPKNVIIDIPSVSIVKNIKGEISGESRISYESGQLGVVGSYDIRGGSFILNNNKFKINGAQIRFVDPVDKISEVKPFVIFEASTKVGKERIEVLVNGYLDNPNIAFKSDSGLSKEQILSALAFNMEVNRDEDKYKAESEDGNLVIGSVANTLLNELIFSPVTGKIGETLGLSNLSVSTDFTKLGKNGQYSGATKLYMQDNLYKDRLYWNLEVKFPFQFKSNNNGAAIPPVPIGYNAWLNYDITNGLEAKIGGETINKFDTVNSRQKNEMNYYIGVDFSRKANSFDELWKSVFRRKKLDVLTK